ncbi:MAG TPA: hypothetical protein VGK32_07995 [Vicinamibacterales bacterium]|jgi:hypothetical protein
MIRRVLPPLLALGFAATLTTTARTAMPGLPARLHDYLTGTAKLTPDERAQLVAGEPVTKMLDADENKEVAVFGAVWVDAPMRRYVALIKDIENFERGGGFRQTRRISAPPKAEDFAAMRMSDEDVADLRTCRVGDCNVKLDEKGLARFQTGIDWNAPNHKAGVESLMRQLALEYVTGYAEGGDERLAVYRDKYRPTFVAQEFREMVDKTPELTAYMPDVRRYLLEYPKTAGGASSSFFYWQETQFGLKPTVRISHLMVREGHDETVVASKMLYANHYFWTGLELRALMPDPSRGPGFWLMTIYRGRADGLGGFTGRFVRGRVRSEVQNAALMGLKMTRQMLEGGLNDRGRP